MESGENLIETELFIDSRIALHLKEAAAWSKFLGVMGFVYSVLVATGGIFAASLLAKMPSSPYGRSSNGNILAAAMVAIVYLAIAGILFIMSIYLFRFAKRTQLALLTNDQETLTDSFRNLKIYFRFSGIITVIALIITVLGVVGLLMISAFNRV